MPIFKNIFKRTLRAQLMFVALAFFAMVVLSYLFARNIVYTHLVNHTTSILVFQQARVENDLFDHKTPLEIFSMAIRDIIMRGGDDTIQQLQNYVNEMSEYLDKNIKHSECFNGLSGYFETLPGGPVFISGLRWEQPQDYFPAERDWYKAAIEAEGEIAETLAFVDIVSRETILIYSNCILDDDGRRLGVVCLRIRVNVMGKDVIETALTQGGYGLLLANDLVMIAHPNAEFVGKRLHEIDVGIAAFEDDLINGVEVLERPVATFNNEDALAFFKELSNGWYIGLLTPKKPYYKNITNMMIFLISLGTALAAVLIYILIRIDAARNKSDKESKHKSAFLANMSHEIRTPMNAIIGMTTIGKSAPNIERKNYCFSKIENASNHLLGVINDILDMSKIEANKFELIPVEFSFEKIIQRVESIINFKTEEKHQTFTVNVDPGIPKNLVADELRLAQVITNLLGNAIKFTPENGSISLDSHFEGEEDGICTIQISISDTGIGITAEQQERLFNSFEQAETGITRKFGGTGLGLTISKNIVEMMGGRIWIKSAPGKGAAFYFTIKAKRAADNVEAQSRQAEAETDIKDIFKGRRVLLAEDIEINREIVQALLEPTGIEIDCAENGVQVMQMFTQSADKYDLILMDVQMPEMDGYETTRRIRQLPYPNAKTIRIIAMTANVFREDINKCLEAGMDDHIGKPIAADEVISTLRMYISENTEK